MHRLADEQGWFDLCSGVNFLSHPVVIYIRWFKTFNTVPIIWELGFIGMAI